MPTKYACTKYPSSKYKNKSLNVHLNNIYSLD